MTKVATYRTTLQSLVDWTAYLLAHSNLPGPRANIELAQAVAEEGDVSLFLRYLTYTPDVAPTNTPEEFLAFCGVLGLGRLIAEGDHRLLETLRHFAADPRWRVREAVAMALQRLGDVDMARLLAEMAAWSRGNLLEQRAAAAALCEPRLLGNPDDARAVLAMLDDITASLATVSDRGDEHFRTLRKGLGYCWSVAVVALPAEGKPLMEKWLAVADQDVRWIMKQNLNKARLARLDAAWVERQLAALDG